MTLLNSLYVGISKIFLCNVELDGEFLQHTFIG